MHKEIANQDQLEAIAIVEMTCRFPGAKTIDQFWYNLRHGVESITFFTEEELEAAGVDPELFRQPNYVKASPVLDDVELFDAAFFKFSPREAEATDPQHRLLLECAWEVLERAGYSPGQYDGRIGVYAGSEMSSYCLNNLIPNRHRLTAVGDLQFIAGVDRSYLCTRLSYELNLRGPSVTLQTSCSTSLVAVHMACESLFNRECDMALAGGVAIGVPQVAGYPYQTAGVSSPDGHCRAFDAQGQGTIFGSGLGLVLLKRLEDALTDGDRVLAVIRGSAINNDGASKIGYMAPSVEGQANVIAEALSVSDVHPETISYVEAHGTATELGDPIEITALTQAYRRHTDKRGYCAIGSVKTNCGHLAAASGAAGLIKTVLALQHGEIPPSLHFERPNPQIDFESSPFYVNAALCKWPTNGALRRAGVSSFGMGGTNAHIVLEEAPDVEPSGESRNWQLLLLSAKTATALEQATDNLAEYLKQHPELDLADVAYTLQVGRQSFSHRRMVVCRDLEDAVTALEARDPKRVFTSIQEANDRPVVFMFPGLGDQHPNMARGLYRSEPEFRQHVDRCAAFLEPHLGLDLRDALFPDDGQGAEAKDGAPGLNLWHMLHPDEAEVDDATRRLNQPSVAYPAVFVVEYALAQLLMSWGIQPEALTGYSTGEYVAACLSGVFSLEEALTLIVRRAELIEGLPGGTMLAVPLSEEQVQPFLGEDVSLSAINGPSLCVLSGSEQAIARLEELLQEQKVLCRRLQTSHAFHSKVMDAILEPFAELVRTTADLQAPQVPYVSNMTGDWVTAEQATDPVHWANHLRRPIRFADGLTTLLADPAWILLEVGPGHALSALAIQHSAHTDAVNRVLPTLPRPYNQEPDVAFVLGALGRLWLAGASVDWQALYRDERRRRVLLPTYPFERKRYWIDPPALAQASEATGREHPTMLDVQPSVAETFHPRPDLPVPYASPNEGVEKKLASIWQRFLGVEEIGRDDNFFRLGGHSLTAMQIVARVREDFQVDIPLRASFEAPTLAELAERVEAALEQARGVPAGSIVPVQRDGQMPLSFAQEQLWLLDRARADGRAGAARGMVSLVRRLSGKESDASRATYNFVSAARLVGSLDVAVLEQSLAEMAHRHEILRTTFPSVDGQPTQVISLKAAVTLPAEDLQGRSKGEQEARVQQLVAEEAKRAFDVLQGPLWRVVLLALSGEEHVLLTSMHPIISDEWSMEVFVRETALLYDAFAAGTKAPLPEFDVQYTDYAAWQRNWLHEDILEAQLSYWERQLVGSSPVLRLPSGRARSTAVQPLHKATWQFEIQPGLVERLRALSQRVGVTLFTTLLAAFNALLCYSTGQQDVLVVTPAANRSRSEVGGLIGRFGNKLALRTRLSAGMAVNDLLQHMRQVVVEAYANQDLPFEVLVENMQVRGKGGKATLFQVMFAFENNPLETLTLSDLEVSVLEIGERGAGFDMVFSMKDRGEKLMGAVGYTPALFSDETIGRLVNDFQTLLEEIGAGADRRLSDVLARIDVSDL